MAEVIRMPRMSDTMEEGVIVAWLKEVGDSVEPGDVLAEVETDKATMELESYQEGTLLYIGVKEGPVPVNGVLAVIGEEGEDYKSALEAAEAENGTLAEGASKESDPEKQELAQEQEAVDSEEPAATDQRVKASPLARSMARDAGIDLSKVRGSGDQGRVVKKDIEAMLEPQSGVATSPREEGSVAPAVDKEAERLEKTTIPPFIFNGDEDSFEDIPVSQMRRTIAKRLGESKFSAPHFYLTMEINMDKAVEARKQMNEIAPTRISFNDLVIKAVAVALRQHPAVNSSWLGDKIRRNKQVNIGVAVAVEEGLLVPVIRHADMKSLSQINMEVRDLAAKAKERKLHLDEMQGNTFTISNLGMFDIEEFTAIINPPDSCILAVGSIMEKPIVENGEIVVGSRMKVTLSCDHRSVDGATGAKFLKTFKAVLEDPIRMLV